LRKEAGLSDYSSGANSANTKPSDKAIQEKSLERMEALLKQSAMGIHILFHNHEIASAMKSSGEKNELFDFNKMKKVQDVMSELIAQQSYYEKVAFLRNLDAESYQLLIRTYFHIVENTVRANSDHSH
jgi:hypothetical protein